MTITTAAPPAAPPTTETRLEKPPHGCRWLVLIGIGLVVFCAVVFRWFFLLITAAPPIPPTPIEEEEVTQISVSGAMLAIDNEDGTWMYGQVGFNAPDGTRAMYDVSEKDFAQISVGKTYEIWVRPSTREGAEEGTQEVYRLEEK